MRAPLVLGIVAAVVTLGAAVALPRLGYVVTFEILLAVAGGLSLRFLLPALGDGPRRPARRWWRRTRDQSATPRWLLRYQGIVEGARRDAAATEGRLLPVLHQLAAERLEAFHDVDAAADPDSARRLLGEAGWRLLRPDWGEGRSAWDAGADLADIDDAVTAIEGL